MIEPVLAAPLSALSNVKHGFFTRLGGVSEGPFASLNCRYPTGDDPAKVAENLSRVSAFFGVGTDKLLSCDQCHSAEVVTVTQGWDAAASPHADAMVTKAPGFVLGILTADCAPVLFADPAAGVIGAAHAGWKGAFSGVLESTVAAMEALGATRAGIVAAIGPCIWQDSYEVDAGFMQQFLDQDFQNNRFFVESDNADHFMFDLPGAVRDRLRKMELGTIALSPADTCADETRFFSYRRSSLKGEAQSGRQISAIMLP